MCWPSDCATPQRSEPVKDLLLAVARFTDADLVLPVALDLVQNRGQPIALRKRALLLIVQHGGDGHLFLQGRGERRAGSRS